MPEQEPEKRSAKLPLDIFLKRFSSIPNAFIEDLFALYGTGTSQSDHVVDLDAVSKWLDIRKDNLLKTLRDGYKKDIDYACMRESACKGIERLCRST